MIDRIKELERDINTLEDDKILLNYTIDRLEERLAKLPKSKEEWADALHCAGLNGHVYYASMGKSAECWNKFRLEIATDLWEKYHEH